MRAAAQVCSHRIGSLSGWASDWTSRGSNDLQLDAANPLCAISVACACQTSIVAAPSHMTHMTVPIPNIRRADMGCVFMVISPLVRRRTGTHLGA
jgi:hypothetical protein